MQVLGDCTYELWRNQRFVALHIDHYCVVRPVFLCNHLGDTVSAAGVVCFSQARLEAMFMHGSHDGLVVGSDPDLLCAALRSLLGDAHYHGFAAYQ